MSAKTSPAAAGHTSPVKVGMASFIGTSVEYYDFFIYGTAAALILPKLFFPEASPLTGTLLSFATFGVGFLARPLGSIVFGHFGDRVGRWHPLPSRASDYPVAKVTFGVTPEYRKPSWAGLGSG